VAKFNPLIFSGIDLTGNTPPPSGAVEWKSPVASEASLPTTGNVPGDARVALDTDKIYLWDETTSKWIDSNLTVSALGATPNADGLTISTTVDGDITRTTINLEPADATNPGAVSATDQSFGGIKTFTTNIVVDGDIDAKGGIESSTGTLDIGTDSVLTSTINIGHSTSTVVIAGTTLYENVQELLVQDKTITLNDGGTGSSAGDAGIEIEEDSSITGYVKVSSDRNTWELKAPGQAGVAVIDGGLGGITLSQSTEELLPLDGSRPMTGSLIMDVNTIEFDDGAGTTLVVDPSSIGFDFDSGSGTTSSADYTSSNTSLSTSDGLITQTFSATPLGMESTYSDSSTSESEASTVNPSGFTQISETPSSSRTIQMGSTSITMDTTEGVEGGLFVIRQLDSASSEIYTNKNLSIESVLDLQLTSSGGNIYVNNPLSLTSNKITEVQDPTDPQDAATKAYVDSLTTDVSQVTKEPTGFPNRDDSSVTFNDLTNTLTISPTSTSFDVYVKGQKFTKEEESIVLTTDPGNHYVYYNSSGVLVETPIFDPSIFTDNALVAIVYWNNETNSHVYFAEERHGLTMDGATHGYLHTVFGARFLSGLALYDFTIDGTGNDPEDAQFVSDQGQIRDEDLLIEIAQQNDIPILYREGSLWRKKSADSYPVIYSGTAGYTGLRLPYNYFDGSSWSLAEVDNNSFVLVHFFGTNDKDNGVVGIQGTNQYSNITAARNAAATEISSLSGLPFAEFVAIGSVIFETADGYTNAPQARTRSIDGAEYVDFRGTQLYTPAGEATTHGLLSGLANDDHVQYLPVNGSRPMTNSLDMGGNTIENGSYLVTSQISTLYTESASYGYGGLQIDYTNNDTLVSSSLNVYPVLSGDGSLATFTTNSAIVFDGYDENSFNDHVIIANDIVLSASNSIKIQKSDYDTFTADTLGTLSSDSLDLKLQSTNNLKLEALSEVSILSPVNMNSLAITSLLDPVLNQDAATKAYVDTAIVAGGSYSGDVNRTSFTALDDQSTPVDVTGFTFNAALVRGFDAIVTVVRGSTYAEYTLRGIQRGASWEMSQDYIGDETGISFSITALGQIQYTSTSLGQDADILFRARTV